MKCAKGIVILTVILLCLSATACSEACTERSGFVFGTAVNIKLYTNDAMLAEEAMKALFDRLHQIEAAASAKDDSSELFSLNKKAAHKPVVVSETLFALIETGIYYSELTGGAFDITLGKLIDLWGIGTGNERVPDRSEIEGILPNLGYENVVVDSETKSVYFANEYIKIDLGGITKGYAGDEAVKVLSEYGIKNAVINLGGNIVVTGNKNGSGWDIAVADPLNPSGTYKNKTLKLSDISVVTSGNYERYFEFDGERYHHILNPETGYPARGGVISATVISESSAEADAFSTALFVMGKADAPQFIEKHGINAVLIDENGDEIRESV